MLKIKKFTFNPIAENTFLVWDTETLEGIVVDPGMYDDREKDEFNSFIKSNSINLGTMLATHCHIDHILGTKFIKDEYSAEYLADEKDLPLIDFAKGQASMVNLVIDELPHPDKFLTADSEMVFNGIKTKVLATPGHSPGEVCFYFEEPKFCITGDVLFKENIGRTDIWGSDYKTILSSIKNKLLTLPDEVRIYPGHGADSTIGYEKLHNPFLQ